VRKFIKNISDKAVMAFSHELDTLYKKDSANGSALNTEAEIISGHWQFLRH